ncbi:MAG: flagellar hook-length control protein FliK [Planctomycetota bacterium]|nr:flagellar hook-length control protein FliK [Planctomycetota bacterium]
MYPSATAFLPSLDARWADPVPSSALETLEKGFPAQAAEEAELKRAAEEHEPLSKKIAKDQEAQARNEAEAEAQDQPDTDSDEAQDSRQSQGMGPVPQSATSRVDSNPRYREGGSNASHGPLSRSQGRVPGQAQISTAIVKPTVSQLATSDTPSIATPTTEGTASGTVVRNVPAAVLRAIEVEASLELGGKGNSSSRSSLMGRSGKLSGTRALAEAEFRTLQGMTSLLAQRGGRLRVHLHPVQLGPIQIDVEVDGDRVRAVIETATRGASKILEASTSRLKAALEAQGYSLDRLEIRQQGLSSGAAEDAEPGGDEDKQDDSQRTREDGHSPRRWRSSGAHHGVDEEFTFAELGEQEHAP